MQRLTQKDPQGNWNLKGVLWNDLHEGQVITKELWEKLYGALWKLMEYEDTGLSPDEIESLNKFEGSYALKYLLELAKHQWIPVEKRLPEKRGNYLCTVECAGCRYIIVGHYNKPGWTDDYAGQKVIAWMPLPEPYKGADND